MQTRSILGTSSDIRTEELTRIVSEDGGKDEGAIHVDPVRSHHPGHVVRRYEGNPFIVRHDFQWDRTPVRAELSKREEFWGRDYIPRH